MRSIRSWLVYRYTLLTLGSLALFVVAMLVARESAANRETEQAYREAEALARDRAQLAQVILRRVGTTGALITVREPQQKPAAEPEVRRPVQLEPTVRDVLNEIRGYVWVLAVDTILYQSTTARALDRDAVSAVQSTLDRMRGSGVSSARVRFHGDGVLVERRETLPNGVELSIVAGVLVSDVSLPPSSLLITALVVLPFVLLLYVTGAHAVAQTALEPLDRITREVAAITDGRSLHRRLHPEQSAIEWSQLTGQLNEMIGRLETSFAALRRFTADASHELKTPLAVLRADVERAMHAKRGGTEQMVALEEALQETTRMADLVESLLTLARADEGRFDIVREPVELEPLVREVMETAIILGENAGLHVRLLRDDPCIVEGDRVRLRQLFLNLVTNAIKYTPKGGDVELSLTATEESAVFSVRDSGIGIAAIDLPHIFDRFYRADRVRSRQAERGGFGLGLSISQWIAQAHGGSLTAQSRLHRGSTFTVTLPVAPPQTAEMPLPEPPVGRTASAEA